MDPLFIPLILPYYAEDRERIKKVSDREDFCAGTKSYDKKLEYLQGEKERILKAYKANNDAIEKLRNGSYIENMNKEQDKCLKRGLFEMITTGFGTTAGYLMWQQYLQGKIDLSKLLDCYLYVCGCYVVPVATLACAAYCIKNYIKYFRYDNEIEAYQRRLK